MAKRPIFVANPSVEGFVDTVEVEFNWFPGFSVSQKQKSINSLHSNFKEKFNQSVLEISSKSNSELGVALSAFNLMIKTKNNKEFSVETAFQSSKVFEKGGPFIDLLEGSSINAKKDKRLKTSGNLTHFQYFNRIWELEPKTLFYDWLYINALYLNENLRSDVINYTAFSDIEFNPQKSINCQAKSAALYVSLHKKGLVEFALKSADNFKEVIISNLNPTINKIEDETKNKETNLHEENSEQLSIFDE